MKWTIVLFLIIIKKMVDKRFFFFLNCMIIFSFQIENEHNWRKITDNTHNWLQLFNTDNCKIRIKKIIGCYQQIYLYILM